MSPIKQRLLEAIERTPESLLEQTLTKKTGFKPRPSRTAFLDF
ncbi:hypothetical protein QUA74_28575 [Microcoleus sp. LAD1_D3]